MDWLWYRISCFVVCGIALIVSFWWCGVVWISFAVVACSGCYMTAWLWFVFVGVWWLLVSWFCRFLVVN